MKPNLGIAERSRESIIKLLNLLLSDEYVLYTKTRKCHWNVTGPHFHDLHKFFEAQYNELNIMVDDVAERARSLGGTSFGTLFEFSKHARLKEAPGKNPNASGMLAELLKDHESLIQTLRRNLETCAKAGDMGTSDFLTGLMEQHEKMAWMLRVMREGK